MFWETHGKEQDSAGLFLLHKETKSSINTTVRGTKIYCDGYMKKKMQYFGSYHETVIIINGL